MCLAVQMTELLDEHKPEALNHARKQIWLRSGGLCFVLVIAWPLLTLPAGVFSQASFRTCQRLACTCTPLTRHRQVELRFLLV